MDRQNQSVPVIKGDALIQTDVDNLEFFDLVITDPDSGREYTGYKEVNIVGHSKAVDL